MEVVFKFPVVFVKTNGKYNVLISHVLSTITTLAAITFMPWAMPVWIAQAQRSCL